MPQRGTCYVPAVLRQSIIFGAATALISSCTFDPGGLLVIEPDDPSDAGLVAAPIDAAPPIDAFDFDPSGCPAGYAGNAETGSAYRMVGPGAPWTLAEDDCENDGDATHLVVIDDVGELTTIVQAYGGNGQQLWLGLSDRDEEGSFRLVTGEPALYLPWHGGEPNDSGLGEDCVELAGDHFNDEGCDLAFNSYVCECDGRAPF
jgi:hypothetical protein